MCNKQHPTRRIWTRREILTLFGAVGTTAIAGSVFQSAAANDIYLPIVHNGEAATATATFAPTAVATATPTATPSVTATPVISDFTGITTRLLMDSKDLRVFKPRFSLVKRAVFEPDP